MLTLGTMEIALLFLFTLMFDVPRYSISMLVLYIFKTRPPKPNGRVMISAIVACHNEERGLRACIESLNVDEVIIVDDGSTDGTWKVIQQLAGENLAQHIIHIPRRSSKPNAVNIGLRYASYEAVLILDSDTVILDRNASHLAARYLMEDPRVGGVSFNLRVRNAFESLTTRFQVIEYLVSITYGKRISDALGTLPNVSGAAGIFRRQALREVGGLDIEVAEDVALTGKLRLAGWKIRFAPDAIAATNVPNTMMNLLMQRLRWDSALAAIWLRKFANNMNPFSTNFTPSNLVTALDVVVFSIILPLLFPVYLIWLWSNIGTTAIIVLMTAITGCLIVLEAIVVIMTTPPPSMLLYIPYYVIMQVMVIRPARIVFVIAEMVAHITHKDNYIPDWQRKNLS